MNENDLKFRTPHGPAVGLASDECLIDELMQRNKLTAVRAWLNIPQALKGNPGLIPDVERKLTNMMGDFLRKERKVAFDIDPQGDMLVFSAQIVALTTLEEESH